MVLFRSMLFHSCAPDMPLFLPRRVNRAIHWIERGPDGGHAELVGRYQIVARLANLSHELSVSSRGSDLVHVDLLVKMRCGLTAYGGVRSPLGDFFYFAY